MAGDGPKRTFKFQCMGLLFVSASVQEVMFQWRMIQSGLRQYLISANHAANEVIGHVAVK